MDGMAAGGGWLSSLDLDRRVDLVGWRLVRELCSAPAATPAPLDLTCFQAKEDGD